MTSSACTDGASSSPSAAWMPPWALAVLDDASPSLVASSTRAPVSAAAEARQSARRRRSRSRGRRSSARARRQANGRPTCRHAHRSMNPTGPLARMPMQMPSPAPAFGRASLGLVALDSPAWALRRGLASLEGDLPAAIVRIDANANAAEVRDGRRARAIRGRAGRVDPRSRSRGARRGARATSCPDVVLDSALCGDELVSALLGVDERLRPRRPAHRSVARRDRARQRGRRVPRRPRRRRRPRPRRRRPAARRLALGRRQGARLDRRRRAGHPGRAAALRQARARRARRPRSRRAQRSATRSTSSPAGTSSCARSRARPPACAAPTSALSARA